MRNPAAATLKRHLLAQVAAIAAICTSAQAPFELDTTFRTEIQQQYVNSIALLSDGGILLSGQMRFPGDQSTRGSAKLLPDGSRDPAFPMFPLTTGRGRLTAWNGGYYVGTGAAVRRLDGAGLIDEGFILMNDGPYFASGQGGDYHVFPDGRVLMSGNHTLNDTARGFVGMHQLIWFSHEGYLDTTRVHRKGNGAVYHFQELPGGGFICSGLATQFDGHAVDRIFRVHADGSVDTTFRSEVVTGAGYAFLPMADGRVYVGGRYARSDAPGDWIYLARFMPDGSLDPTFSIPQLSLGAFPVSSGMAVACLYPWDQGRLIVTGQFQYVNGEPRNSICMLDSTGALQDMFAGCGIGPFTDQGYIYGSIERVVRDTLNNYLYVNGAYNGYSDGTTNDSLQRFVTRLRVGDITTGSAPLSLGEGPVVRVYPNPSSGSVTVQLETLPRDAQVVVRDALGREVQRQRLADHYTTLSMTHSGVYTLEVWSAGERLSTQRLVVE